LTRRTSDPVGLTAKCLWSPHRILGTMSQETTEYQQFHQKSISDYLDQAAKALYVLGAILFLGGLWIDWQNPGEVIIDFLVFTDEPYANSGLFIGAIIVMAFGFLISRSADMIEEYRKEEVEDQTQEWVVDVGHRE